MVFEEDYIDRKLKGSLAEQLFELLHSELKCFILRTGQEVLYPNLLQIANLKKKVHHKLVKNEDINRITKEFDDENAQGNFGHVHSKDDEIFNEIKTELINNEISKRFVISNTGDYL